MINIDLTSQDIVTDNTSFNGIMDKIYRLMV